MIGVLVGYFLIDKMDNVGGRTDEKIPYAEGNETDTGSM